ncbi:hypothetical protein [Actinomyces culturomici]|uniref:hypothetical protein n=1 Tax=Actinomyces culturomici TaxID=1926276 RepID=UPI000E204BAC|nr:hypothetical protein [Actinomyces culturomici]
MSKTAAEIEKELAAKNSEARALRRALKEAQQRELLSAKTALGEAVATLVFADTPEAMQALVRTLNGPGIADEVRRLLGTNSTENRTAEEPKEELRWGSDEGYDQADTDVPAARW